MQELPARAIPLSRSPRLNCPPNAVELEESLENSGPGLSSLFTARVTRLAVPLHQVAACSRHFGVRRSTA
jgi:hypothetical protein